jgi:CheY-like chemotaxis protein/anti-sigma regulatory factor (Ser/Thr protein kinase)
VHDLLEVSRITRGNISLQCQLVDLTDLAMRCVQATKERAKAHTHKVSFETDGNDALVHGDPVRLEQILTNLLVNACKYTPKGGRIVVSVETSDGMAVVRVRDNGIGISEEMLGRIFDPFTQADRSLDRSQGGLGLGLHLARELVQLHHGTIEAKSDGPGMGSELTVRLPIVIPTVSTPPAPPVRGKPDGHDPALRVLVVEDADDIRESLQILLQDRGHVVEVAANGRLGVERAERFVPDVALVDVGLPELDGYEVARRLRAMSDGMLLVAMTGYGQPEDRRRALSAGFNEHLIKPVDIDRLAGMLRRVGGRPLPEAMALRTSNVARG